MNTKPIISALAIAISLTLAGCHDDNQNSQSGNDAIMVDTSLLQYVDPMIGTAASGHTFPGAAVPGGMVQLSPDTFIGSGKDHEAGQNPWHSASGYWDASDYATGQVFDTDLGIYGFSHTHLSGTGASDLADFLVLPYSNKANAEINLFDKRQKKRPQVFILWC